MNVLNKKLNTILQKDDITEDSSIHLDQDVFSIPFFFIFLVIS